MVRSFQKKGGARLDIYDQYAKPVYRFLLRLTGNAHQAEDLLQETFCQALTHISRFEGRSSLYTWLCRIGKNAWLKECSRRSHYVDTAWEDLPLADPGPTPEEAVLRKETLRRIQKAVLKLEEPYKEVFILHIYGDLKLKDIAALNGKSESWARVTYHRARNKIAKEVSDDEAEL